MLSKDVNFFSHFERYRMKLKYIRFLIFGGHNFTLIVFFNHSLLSISIITTLKQMKFNFFKHKFLAQ